MFLQLLEQLDHVSIVRLEEVFYAEGKVLMVLEYLPGGDLFDGLVSRPFYSEKDACACAHQIITALNYLSMKGIIHRVRKDTRGGSSVNGLVTFSEWWGLQLSHILNGTLAVIMRLLHRLESM